MPKKVDKTKYIGITGGVISSVGKGILTSSIAQLIEAQGYKVTAVKVDPYINVDAGTMRPTEHGEVYVTEDGFETDQDLGNYERFTTMTTLKDNSITTGQIYQKVIEAEREGKYGGKCVEVIPAIPNEIIRRLKKVSRKTDADFVLVEVGGTVGEYQIFPFIDALRRLDFEEEKGKNVVSVHVGLMPIPSSVGEQKTKPLQQSINKLKESLHVDFVVARSERKLDKQRIEKIAQNCSIRRGHVISAYDEKLLYKIPMNLREQDLDIKILSEFGLPYLRTEDNFGDWEERVKKILSMDKELNIGIVGKYFNIGDSTLTDSYISVIEAVKHGCWENGYRAKITWINSGELEKDKNKVSKLDKFDGIIVPGGFGATGIEGKILAIEHVREKRIPYLGLCYGLQTAVIEYARNVCGLTDAHTTEIEEGTEHPVIHILPEQKKKLDEGDFGGSMRLGAYKADLSEGTIVRELYGQKRISERHRHRWEVHPDYIEQLENSGLVISGRNPELGLVEFIELPAEKHPFFVATQAHPEFKSKFLEPSPLFVGFGKACAERYSKK
jgi:CTP synthase